MKGPEARTSNEWKYPTDYEDMLGERTNHWVGYRARCSTDIESPYSSSLNIGSSPITYFSFAACQSIP
jgi:hypothetical protein